MTIKQLGGVFGRNPTFNDVTIDGELILNGEIFTGLDFQGSWNASTNTPTLASGVGTTGEFYIVSVAGTTNLDGITNWGVGDWAMFSGSAWQRVEGNADGNFVNLSVSNEATFPDNAKAIFGTGSDLQIYHDGSHSYIKDTATGNLRIDGTDIQIRSDAGANMAAFVAGAEVQLYHNNQKKFETTATGVDISGNLEVAGNNNAGSKANFIRITDTDTSATAANPQGGIEFYTSDTGNENVTASIVNLYAGSGAGSELTFNTAPNGASGVQERLRIDDSGNVGIGTASNLTNGTLNVQSNGTSVLQARSDAAGTNDGDTTVVVSRALNSTAGKWSNAIYRGYSHSWSYGSSAGTNQAMTIDSSGNVGIGTASPSRALEVYGAVAGVIAITSNSTDGISSLSFGDTADDNAGRVNYLNASDAMLFYTATAERMRIDSSGNVGIGTSSPDYPLHVKGTTNILKLETSSDGRTQLGGYDSSGNTNFLVGSADSTNAEFWNYKNGYLRFATNSTERLRIDASGNLLVGKTSADNTTQGIRLLGSAGFASFVRDSAEPIVVNRLTDDGDLIEFRADGAAVGSIGVVNSNNLRIGGVVASHAGLQFGTNILIPETAGTASDGLVDIGTGANRYQDVYATNGTIQTSDGNEKQDIEELSEAEQRVAVAAKGLLRKFRWKSAVETKGDEARTHFGIIAQDLQAAFAAEGLDAGDYGMFINSTWTDEETGEERSRMGVRYSELLAFIISSI